MHSNDCKADYGLRVQRKTRRNDDDALHGSREEAEINRAVAMYMSFGNHMA